MSGTRTIGIGLLALGLACGVVSTAIDYWYYYDSVTEKGQTVKAYFGLWELCAKIATQESKCQSFRSLEDQSGGALKIAWLHACQAMMGIGAALNVAACVAAIYATMKQMAMRTAQVAAGVGGICYLIAAAIFGAKYEDSVDGKTSGHLHAGFGLAILAGLINLVSTGVLARALAGGSYERVN